MGWRTVVVNSHSKLSYKNQHLVFKSAYQHEMIHLSEIDVLILETTDITLTTMLINCLVAENILILFCDDKRLPIGKVLPFYGRHDSSLQLSKQLGWDSELKSEVWTEIISQKILNQSTFLSMLNYDEKADSLIKLHETLEIFDPTNREGHAARIYFNQLFGNDFTREQENDINSGLNYGYTLLLSIFARELVKSGCMTQFGLKHSNQFNDFNFASDIMEPFRPLVDQIVYEKRNEDFQVIKRSLFELFNKQFDYNDQHMFLTNIASDYTKKIVKVLNEEREGVPEFRI
ncbi:TPA: type II CRISPR-associated endonuclease Cas1 [Listeria monocytogenes]|uniref:CRISPR-associated endonuclease Cas1 n=2 Tax=Listeria monocytogenes TaxID=1639 RepID=A0A9P1YGC3_LISMN|nr:type II CRISPR-associated endonuclease Cas1 [Listeria monocytogenes]EAE3730415.1 type II CRISPR-associated endonuclease Cas1 [Listeria monocytogenes serotype 1/2a]EAG6290122.1 type II CRISPR-associated endonuclease Cas1 [Listeria monocytogenes CFSAN003825]EAG6317376.1 type II CRISPR-associated endonuclease Cas1 [Listeria monocytogenes CFSAN003824]EAG6341403.1 type II CRISPR-associated endonuclease Cas1 [Listeria monocytogenes CFSAN003811]AVS32751.1 type II CRISPR-associated endonuclease Cas